MGAGRTSLCLVACLALLPATAHAGARVEIDDVSQVMHAGEPAHLRVRLSFTGERSCRVAFTRGRVTQTTRDTLTEHRLVTWRWRVPRDARSGRWALRAECGAEAELTARVERRVRLVGAQDGRRVVAARVSVFTSGDPLVVAFVNRP